MLRIVPDTNFLVSSVITKGNEYQILKLAKLGKIKLILSLEILEEFEEVINRAKFGFSRTQIERAIKQISTIAEIVKPFIKIKIIEDDPDDNKIIEAAIAGKVDYIVSGDKHLLRLKRFNEIKIINAREFLSHVKI